MFAVASAENFRPLVSKRYWLLANIIWASLPMFSTFSATRQYCPCAFWTKISPVPTWAMPHLTAVTVKANFPSRTVLPSCGAAAAAAAFAAAALSAAAFAAAALSAMAWSAAAWSAAAWSGVGDVADVATWSPTGAMVTDLVPPLARLENIPINKSAPMAVRILCRRNQFFRATAGGDASGVPGAKFSVHCWPSQYLCWPSGCGYQPAGVLMIPVFRSSIPVLSATYRLIRHEIRGLPE